MPFQTTLILHKQKLFTKKENDFFWTRIHTFGENCLKVTTDKAKQLKWNKTINGHCCLEWLFQGEFLLRTMNIDRKCTVLSGVSRTHYAGTSSLSEF